MSTGNIRGRKATCLNREIKIGLTEESVFEQRLKISEGISHVGICKRSMPGRKGSGCSWHL